MIGVANANANIDRSINCGLILSECSQILRLLASEFKC